MRAIRLDFDPHSLRLRSRGKQVCAGGSERLSERFDVVDRYISFAPLDRTDIRSVELSELGKLFLTQA
jgi:hypothetical protein